MSRPRQSPDRALLEFAWQDVVSRGFQMFAYYHWWSLEREVPALLGNVTSITVKNAALESSLMSLRDLDDFFLSDQNARDDDALACDFGFPTGRHFLTSSERNGINKKLAHLTYRAATERRNDPLSKNPRTWNNADLVKRGGAPLLAFFDHLEVSFFKGNGAQIGLINTARKTIELTLKNITAITKSEIDFEA